MATLTFPRGQYRIFNTLYIAASLDQFLGHKAAAWSHGHDGRMTCRRSLAVGAQHDHVIWRDLLNWVYINSAQCRLIRSRKTLVGTFCSPCCDILSCTILLYYISVLRQCGGRRTLVIVLGDFVSSFLSMFLSSPGDFCSTVRSVSSCVEGMQLVCI